MYGAFIQRLMLFLFPTAILAALYVSFPYWEILSPSWRNFMPYVVYLTLSLGLFLSFHFNRSRVFFVLLLLFAFCWNSTLLSASGGEMLAPWKINEGTIFLLPINITLVCLMREKGLLSPAGRKRLFFFAFQVIVLLVLAKTTWAGNLEASEALRRSFLEKGRSLPAGGLPLMSGCGFIITAVSYFRRSLIDSAFFGVLVALFFVFTHPPAGDFQMVFLFGAGLILSLSVLQDTHNMAYRDDLTGALSRRAFNEHLSALGRRYAIAMIDLDHFKRVNDSYGHEVGDQVLRMAGAKMRSVGGGRVYRYGGEEFAVVFPGKKVADVTPRLEELRARIASYRFAIRGTDRPVPSRQGKKNRSGGNVSRTVSVTVSIGVADCIDGKKSSRDVIVAADAELYRAKQGGRNRISVS